MTVSCNVPEGTETFIQINTIMRIRAVLSRDFAHYCYSFDIVLILVNIAVYLEFLSCIDAGAVTHQSF